ncbi:NADH-quinone oxidoreductase subunit N [Microbacterium sp. LRZ72]|uniref:NADH-quinone oxidoreductase subunit N n=1 Tax=Microbacterium sp. LRZ72 TaxID=2942481 RepID=UPI0029AE6445|nr:proton-conducting transporter membrane subunit [Microbacterium sp. LRZ72]MDX2377721.1 NADH-quinone oxidoreductase subunit N [Microbacterium sp. LRZ72]
MNMDPLLLLPELLLFLGGLSVLLLGSFLPRRRQWIAAVLTATVLVLVMAATAFTFGDPTLTAYAGTEAVDIATRAVRFLAPLGTLLVVALAAEEVRGDRRESETYALLLFATTGTVLLAGANDLLVLAVAFLLTSIPLYALIGLGGTAKAAEAAMKTYLLGSIFGILMLVGIALLASLGGSSIYSELKEGLGDAPIAPVILGVLFVLSGILFKAGGVPAHYWVPDAAQASGAAVAAFVTTVPKVGAVVAIYRLVVALPETADWGLLVALLAAAGMVIGNLAAYFQNDPRRLLGWSTVGQVGFLLIPPAVATPEGLPLSALLLYLAAYVLTNIAAFAVIAAEPGRRDLAEYRGLARTRPWLAAALVVALLGLVGTPPLAVFLGKVTVTAAALDGDALWLALVLLVTTVISLFYYLRWLIIPFRSVPEGPPAEFARRPWAGTVAVAAATGSLLLGLGAGLAWGAFTGELAI